MTITVGIAVFPGTNCEHDVARLIEKCGYKSVFLWHNSSDTEGCQAIILPGGFAHGDYLRPGAIAKFSPLMEEIVRLSSSGLPVIGICNGFQILTEAGLLEGTLQKNKGLKFKCSKTRLEIRNAKSALTCSLKPQDIVNIPINHFSGNYYCTNDTLKKLFEQDQVILTYTDNPNGSVADIAGICSPKGNVVGLMPHPERAADDISGNNDGILLFNSISQFIG